MGSKVTRLFHRWAPQPVTGSLTFLAALSLAGVYGLLTQSGFHTSWRTWLLAAVLTCVTAASYLCPIHLRHNMKLYMATVPLFILAAAAPPLVAFCFAFAGTFAREMLARKHTGAYVSDVVGVASTSATNVIFASAITQLDTKNSAYLLLAAAAFWLLEALLLPVIITPISGEAPWRVIEAFVRGAGIPDAVQLGVGVLGALVAVSHPWALGLIAIPAYFIYASFKNAREMHEGTRDVLARLADTVDLRDTYTGGHSRRVAEYTASILRCMDKNGPEADLVTWAARVHDIGKIGIPDAVLLKEDRLDPAEEAIMQTHPDKGAEFLRQHREFARGIEVVRYHHERWDGMGYPAGMKGQAIPWGARVVAVADAFDAMTSDRPYRKGLAVEKALAILAEGRAKQWDAAVVDAFLTLMAEPMAESFPVSSTTSLPAAA